MALRGSAPPNDIRSTGLKGPSSGISPNTPLVVLGMAVLLNAAATAYGFAQLDKFAHVLRWDLLPAAVQPADPGGRTARSNTLTIEFWADYTCVHCINSAQVLLTLREEMEQPALAWSFRFLPRATEVDDLGLQLALLGHCSQRPWMLLSYVAGESGVGDAGIRTFLDRFGPFPKDVESCLASETAMSKIWQDRLEAARRGILVTPTLIVDGVKLEGELLLAPVTALIEDRLHRRQGS